MTNPSPRSFTPPPPLAVLACLLAFATAASADVGDVVTAADDATIGTVEARMETMHDLADSLVEGTDELIDISEHENEELTDFSRLAQQIVDQHVHRSLLTCADGCVNPRLMVPADHGGHLDRVLAVVGRNLDNADHAGHATGASWSLLADAAQAQLMEENELAFSLACAAFHAVGAE